MLLLRPVLRAQLLQEWRKPGPLPWLPSRVMLLALLLVRQPAMAAAAGDPRILRAARLVVQEERRGLATVQAQLVQPVLLCLAVQGAASSLLTFWAGGPAPFVPKAQAGTVARPSGATANLRVQLLLLVWPHLEVKKVVLGA